MSLNSPKPGLLRVLLYLMPVVVWAIMRFWFGYDGLYGQDAYEYLRVARAIGENAFGDQVEGLFWPVIYPLWGAMLRWIVRDYSLALQLISLGGLLMTLRFLEVIFKLEKDQPAYIPGLLWLGVALSPFMMRFGISVMSDSLATGLVTGTLYFALSFRKEGEFQKLMLMALFGGLAVFTRYLSALVVFPVLAWSLWPLRPWKSSTNISDLAPKIPNRRLWTKSFLVLAGVFSCLALPALIQLLYSGGKPGGALDLSILAGWSPLNYFRSDFVQPMGTMHYRLPNWLYMGFPFFHPGFFSAMGLGLTMDLIMRFFSMAKTDWKIRDLLKPGLLSNGSWLMLIMICIYLLFVGGLPLQNARYFLLISPLIFVFIIRDIGVYKQNKRLEISGTGFIKSDESFGVLNTAPTWYLQIIKRLQNRWKWLFAGLLLGQSFFCVYYLREVYLVRDFEKIVVERVLEEGQKSGSSHIFTFYLDGALKVGDLSQKVVNMWNRPIGKAEIYAGDLVLFDPERFEEQWKGKNPMLNWKFLSTAYRLDSLHDFDNGWVLYRVTDIQEGAE